MDAQDPLLTEEVRVAMALNGGVSLAVWMGGAAVELDAARRAHLSDERPVYAAICRAFRRELVLDLMTGSSAGGINGALLAGAIAWHRQLTPDFLRGKWIELGDFSRLLQPLSKSDPPSLMQGTYFHERLEATFKDLHDGKGGTVFPHEGSISDRVHLEVTTTDMRGGEVRFRDVWGEELVAHEYRRRFSFEKRDAQTTLDPEQLAIAARSSASFPVAFEPFGVEDGTLIGLEGKRYVLDGGLLDNAPIRDVIDLIPTRSADRQVRRYLCYVNADPPLPGTEPQSENGAEPKLGTVALAVVGLPRKATFVDHLNAIKQATREGRLAGTGEQDLVRADRDALYTTAGHLLDAYRQRRRVQSLEDVLADPRDVEAVIRSMPKGVDLPWIPATLAVPDEGWGWGVRAAQRALHLLIDVLRATARNAAPEARERLFAARAAIDVQVAALEAVHRDVSNDSRISDLLMSLTTNDDREGTVRGLAPLMTRNDAKIREAVRAGVLEAHQVADLLPDEDVRGLFGAPAEDAHRIKLFLERALTIEVVRRAFAADDVFDTAQRLSFAQLTPCAPALILTSRPLNWQDKDEKQAPPATPEAKLTGLPVAHFAAFYRASWRANDFMWGRLDGAVRVVDMLVDGDRAIELADRIGAKKPWAVLADALTQDATAAEVALLLEAIGPAGDESLRDRLAHVLEDDLRHTGGRLTRAVCARALQHEILAAELPTLVKTSAADAADGAGVSGLTIDGLDEQPVDMVAAIDDLRSGAPLPKRLGVSEAELASDLGLRTVAHAAMVGVAAVRTAGTPLGDAVGALRAPFLPVAGTVARSWVIRAALAVAFTAFAGWLGWRAVAVADLDKQNVAPAIEDLSMWTVVVTLLAALGVVTTAAVAAWRALKMPGWRAHTFYGVGALALLATGGAVQLALAYSSGGIQLDELITQADATDVPDAVLILIAGTSLGIPALVMLGAGRIKAWGPIDKMIGKVGLSDRLDNFVQTPYAGLPSLVLLLAPWAALLVWTVFGLFDEQFAGWEMWALIATIAAPVVALAVLLPRPRPRPAEATGLGLAGLPSAVPVTVTQRPLPPGTTAEQETPPVRD
jgi:predicted acylesterase/phospholipase RssA